MESFSENAGNQFQTAAAVFLADPLHVFSLQPDLQDKREICSELESIREIEKNTVSKSRLRLPYHSDLLTAARVAGKEGDLLRIGDTQPHINIRQPLTPFPFHRSLLAVGGASCKNIDTWPNRKVRVPARSPLTVCCR